MPVGAADLQYVRVSQLHSRDRQLCGVENRSRKEFPVIKIFRGQLCLVVVLFIGVDACQPHEKHTEGYELIEDCCASCRENIHTLGAFGSENRYSERTKTVLS